MTTNDHGQNRSVLQAIARRVMVERGLLPDFPAAALAELNAMQEHPPPTDAATRDLRSLLWSSIDNDDSRDLDQLTVAQAMPHDAIKVLVAIADVDDYVRQGSALDDHARQNTTSVYTAAQIFPMLPERLSTDLSSLNDEVDRAAVVIEMTVASDGSVQGAEPYRATVRNHAKLAYNSVAAWLEATGPMPAGISDAPGLGQNLRLQEQAAQRLRTQRHLRGSLDLETIQARPVFDGDQLQDLRPELSNVAKNLIEDFMIAANSIAAEYLHSKGFPVLRRVVRTPRRWDRIVELAAERGTKLPAEPDARALEDFMVAAKAADAMHFPDLSLSIVKLMGPGEYIAELPGGTAGGHFGLAVKDYAHSTAPNRRYPDLVTQRLLKAAIASQPSPYEGAAIEALAQHCTEAEDAAKKVERQVAKSAAAMLLQSRRGEVFDALVTGSSEKGTWVRLFHPPVEGRLNMDHRQVDVGQKLRVRLTHTDVQRGFIDLQPVP